MKITITVDIDKYSYFEKGGKKRTNRLKYIERDLEKLQLINNELYYTYNINSEERIRKITDKQNAVNILRKEQKEYLEKHCSKIANEHIKKIINNQ